MLRLDRRHDLFRKAISPLCIAGIPNALLPCGVWRGTKQINACGVDLHRHHGDVAGVIVGLELLSEQTTELHPCRRYKDTSAGACEEVVRRACEQVAQRRCVFGVDSGCAVVMLSESSRRIHQSVRILGQGTVQALSTELNQQRCRIIEKGDSDALCSTVLRTLMVVFLVGSSAESALFARCPLRLRSPE